MSLENNPYYVEVTEANLILRGFPHIIARKMMRDVLRYEGNVLMPTPAKCCQRCGEYYPGDCHCGNRFPGDCNCSGCKTMRLLNKSKRRKDKRILDGFYHAQMLGDLWREEQKNKEKKL